MITTSKENGITWVDVHQPTDKEIDELAADYQLHPLVATALGRPSPRSKVDIYSDYIFLILQFPRCQICYGERADGETQDTEEVDFVIGADFLITVHYGPMEALNEFSRMWQTGTVALEKKGKLPAGILFFHLAKHLYGSLEAGLDFINSVLKRAEKKIFSGGEKEMVHLLTDLNRDLLDFRWALKNHREVLYTLAESSRDFFGEKLGHHLTALLGEFERVWNTLESNRATFLDLRETNESLLTIKTNETVKLLTVITFIFFPLTFISQLFGMNTSLPFADTSYDFLAALGIMIASVLVLFAVAKSRKWL